MIFRYLLPTFSMVVAQLCYGQFDTSTPENYLQALAEVPASDPGVNPIPFFYETESAAAIVSYDAIGATALGRFQVFKKLLAEQLPDRVVSEDEKSIQVEVDNQGVMLRKFSLSGALIGVQLRDRSPSDYAFVSATEPDENGVVKLTCRMMGQLQELEIKDFGDGYRMWLDAQNLMNVRKMSTFFEAADALISEWIDFIEQGRLNVENYHEVVIGWSDDFAEVVAMLN